MGKLRYYILRNASGTKLAQKFLLALISATVLSILVGCEQKKDPSAPLVVPHPMAPAQPPSDVIKTAAQVPASALHLCDETGSRLTKEDCESAKTTLKKVTTGTAAINAPSWMLQGQTRVVTLAVGTAPPPEPVASQPAASKSVQPAPKPSAPDIQTPNTKPNEPSVQPKDVKKARPMPSPHDTAKRASGSRKVQIVDYYPLVGRRMTAELIGDGFTVKPKFFKSDQPLSDDTVTTWEWEITATDYGKRTLIIKTNVVMINSQGRPESLKPTTEYKEVVVYIGVDGVCAWLKALPDWLKTIAAILGGITAILGAWRTLKATMKRRNSKSGGS